MTIWRKLSESSPPLSSDAFLFEPGRDEASACIWHVYIGSGGMVEFELPMQMWLDYTIEENEKFMKEKLDDCTHWSPIWDAIQPPEVE